MVLLRLWCAGAMLHKTSRPYNANELQPGMRLAANIIDLYADNVVSGTRSAELLNDAARAGVSPARPLQTKTGSNQARSLRRKLLKKNKWPEPYMALVRVWNPKTHQVDENQIAFWLPHELLATLARESANGTALYAQEGLDPETFAHLRHCEGQAGTRLVCLGLWGDGAPCNWDRTESLETFALNFPGLAGAHAHLRIPLTCFSKKIVANGTFDDCLEIIAWSLRHAALGKFPSCRHDGAAFGVGDHHRAANAGRDLGCAAALCEIRADWAFLKEVFHMPGWREKGNCCWKCKVTSDGSRLAVSDLI